VPVPVRGAKQRALLALRRGQPVSADRLIDVLWGDGQAANPANALQAQIGQLRRTLGRITGLPVHTACLGDLHGERADAARGADDQDLLASLHVPVVADRLQGGQAGNGYGRGPGKGEVRGLGREPVGPGPCVLGERALGGAEHLFAHRQRRHVPADRLDAPGDLPASYGVLGARIPYRARRTG
jgi:hypothetical protein